MEIILKDVKSFDPRIWIYAVSVSMSAMVLLGCTVCLLLVRDHYEELEFKRQQGKRTIKAINRQFNGLKLSQKRTNGIPSNWCLILY